MTPHSEQAAGFLKAGFGLGLAIGRTGAWLKEKRSDPDGELSITVNVRGVGKDGELTGVRIYEMDASGREVRSLNAEHAVVPRTRTIAEWTLQDVTETRWIPGTAASEPRVEERKLPQMAWPTKLTAAVATASILPVQSMGAVDLWRYSNHLAEQEQSTQTYRIQFWKRVCTRSCLVWCRSPCPSPTCARAAARQPEVFSGVMLGINFVLLNNVVTSAAARLDAKSPRRCPAWSTC